MTTPEPAKAPRAFRLDAVEPAKAEIIETADPFDVEAPSVTNGVETAARGLSLVSIFLGALGLFLSLAFGLWGWTLIEEMIAANPVLGWLLAGLGAIVLLALLALIIREWWGLRRLARVETLREDAAKAAREDDREGARGVIRGSRRFLRAMHRLPRRAKMSRIMPVHHRRARLAADRRACAAEGKGRSGAQGDRFGRAARFRRHGHQPACLG